MSTGAPEKALLESTVAPGHDLASSLACDPALEERWRTVLAAMDDAVRLAGRPAGCARLIAVSKRHSALSVAQLYTLGQQDFGENYMQEARAKQASVAALLHHANPEIAAGQATDLREGQSHGGPVRWHAIGALQSNKAKDAAGHFALVHSVDSLKLAKALAKRMTDGAPEAATQLATDQHSQHGQHGQHGGPAPDKAMPVQDVLVQVNIGDEPQKAGVPVADLPALAEAMAQVPGIRMLGLMCLPPRCGEGDAARPYFCHLRELRDALEKRMGQSLPHLSMGMSGDYPQAIAEGATLIRVGTDIFGPRPL